jgi:hypothetical protein
LLDPALFLCTPEVGAATVETEQRPWVFFGNLSGPVRNGRYARLSLLHHRLDIWGQCPADPLGMHRGYVKGVEQAARLLGRYEVGINVPQFFVDYHGTPYDFGALQGLGQFFLPSRVVQYAAVGLPVVTVGLSEPSAHFLPPFQRGTRRRR